MAYLLGFALGIVASLIAWWVVALTLTPRLLVSEISKVPDETGHGGSQYRLKVVNKGRRHVADLQVHIVLVVRGLNPKLPSNRSRFRIPAGLGPVYPVLEARDYVLVGLQVSDLSGNAFHRLPASIQLGLSQRDVSLENLLDLEPEAFLRVAIGSAHHLSGFRRTLALKYTRDNIKPGRFRRGLTVEVVPTA